MTYEEALREAARFARDAAALYRHAPRPSDDMTAAECDRAQVEAQQRAAVAAQISLAHSQLAAVYLAEAQS